jgi:uncharacterized protein (UPF0276 family)
VHYFKPPLKGVVFDYFPAKKLLDWQRISAIARFLKEQQATLVHSHLTYANIVGTLAGQLLPFLMLFPFCHN